MAWHLCASALHTNPLWDGTGFPFATLGGKVVLVLLQSKEGAGKGVPPESCEQKCGLHPFMR